MLSPDQIGAGGEAAALEYYKNQGYTLVDKNFYNTKGLRFGEIDLIVIKGTQLVFVEVKTRSRRLSAFGTALDSITRQKQAKIRKAVYLFLKLKPQYQKINFRVDICEVHYRPVDNKFEIVNNIINAVEE